MTPRIGYHHRMTSDDHGHASEGGLHSRVQSRAEPLPEEQAAETGAEDREAEAAEILRDSEQRIAEADRLDHPAEAAEQQRSSEETL